jgi:general nucleoside transport system permease protein
VIRVERRARVPTSLVIAGSIIAATTTLIITACILGFTQASPISVVRVMILAAFGSPAAIADTVALAASLMLTGLAATLTFRVGLINLGLEGQLIASALAALMISSGTLPVPALAIIPFAIVAGLVVGALSVAVVTVLKARLRVDEAIITIFLSVVMVFALQLMTSTTMSGLPPIGTTQALPIVNLTDFPDWGQALHRSLEPLVAVTACVLAYVLLRYTIWGLDIRATGGNSVAARFAGIHVNFVRLRVASVSGMLIGLAGAGPVISVGGGSTASLTLGLGYAGIAVAFLAAFEPLGILLAALFVAPLLAGIKAANQQMDVPLGLASVSIALLLITALMAQSAIRYQMHWRSRSEAS